MLGSARRPSVYEWQVQLVLRIAAHIVELILVNSTAIAPHSSRSIARQQVVLETLDVELLIPKDHSARNIWELLGGMDLSRFSAGLKSVRAMQAAMRGSRGC